VKVYPATGGPWQQEFFKLAGFVLDCKLRQAFELYAIHGELDYGTEMRLVLSDVGMLPAQRLGRCAGRVFSGRVARQAAPKSQVRFDELKRVILPGRPR
jgi:hypothetical protein